jgi:cardiolipin synthase
MTLAPTQQIAPTTASTPPVADLSLAPRGAHASGVTGSGRTSWSVYNESTVTSAIVDAVNGAKQVVNAEFFGVADAGKGAALTDALVGAARRGVEVNVIADIASFSALPVGSFHRFRSRVTDAGGNVIVVKHLPILPSVIKNPSHRHVDHRKAVTIDGAHGFVGGMNYMSFTDAYRDTMVHLTGDAGSRLAAEQLDRWQRVAGEPTAAMRSAVAQALAGASGVVTPADDIAIVTNAPEQKRFEISDRYRELIRGAKERLWVVTPGMSDQSIIADIKAAADRGVDVRVITPGKPPLGIPAFNWIARSHLSELEQHGAKAYETSGVVHRKALLVDDEVVLSSYNLTERSRENDHEVGVASRDPKFVQAIQQVLEEDMRSGREFDPSEFRGAGRAIGDLIAQRLKLSY